MSKFQIIGQGIVVEENSFMENTQLCRRLNTHAVDNNYTDVVKTDDNQLNPVWYFERKMDVLKMKDHLTSNGFVEADIMSRKESQ